MAKQSQRQRYGNILREFTRMKYRKMKLVFPKWRQANIVAKILRQWDAIPIEEKEIMLKNYRPIEVESSSSQEKPKKVVSKKKSIFKPKNVRSQPKSPKVRVFVQKAEKKMKDIIERPISEGVYDSSESDIEIKPKTVEKVFKQRQPKAVINYVPEKKTQWFNFFKYYHVRLTAQHPRWDEGQKSMIIRLLWKKRFEKKKEKKAKQVKPTAPISGYEAFKNRPRDIKYSNQEIRQMWRALPPESKKYWTHQGNPALKERAKNRSNLSFMSKREKESAVQFMHQN